MVKRPERPSFALCQLPSDKRRLSYLPALPCLEEAGGRPSGSSKASGKLALPLLLSLSPSPSSLSVWSCCFACARVIGMPVEMESLRSLSVGAVIGRRMEWHWLRTHSVVWLGGNGGFLYLFFLLVELLDIGPQRGLARHRQKGRIEKAQTREQKYKGNKSEAED